MQHDPIRQLSQEEYDKLKSRYKTKTRLEANAAEIVRQQMLIGEEGLEIGGKAWEMRKKGRSLARIAKELKVPMEVLQDCLKEFETRVSMEAGRLMTHCMALDIERIDDMMGYWFPLATAGPINIERVRAGEIFSEADFDRPLKAGYFVLQAIAMRLKMLLAMQGKESANAEQLPGNQNIIIWLQQVLPQVTKELQLGHNGERLVLETQAEKEGV